MTDKELLQFIRATHRFNPDEKEQLQRIIDRMVPPSNNLDEPGQKFRWAVRNQAAHNAKYPAIQIGGSMRVQVLQQKFTSSRAGISDEWRDVPIEIEG
jgi:hypothetical protein